MKKWSIIVPLLVLSTAALLLFLIPSKWNTWRSDATVQKTNDAYVTANQIPLSTRISGTVRRVDIGDYQPVRRDQLILELEDSDFQAAVEECQAAIDAARAMLAANQDAKRSADASIRAQTEGIAEARAMVDAAKAGVDAARAEFAQADSEYERQDTLLSAKATTHQRYEQALAARDSSRAALQSRRADLTRAQAALASSRSALTAALQQRAALDAKDREIEAQIVAKKASLTIAKVNLGYTKIEAPASGRIGRLQVHSGQLVGAGAEVVDFVQAAVWLEANFQETQVAHIRPGDVVDIRIDALPGKVFQGHVAEVAPASGSATALLPPDNATGNFTKVIQRIPVKILFDDNLAVESLRPGMSAEVTVHTNRPERSSIQ